MDKLVAKIVSQISDDFHRLSIVTNTDGWLKDTVLKQKILEQGDIQIIFGSNLFLRTQFELIFKKDSERKCCYVIDNQQKLLPDISKEAYTANFNMLDLFPAFHRPSLLQVDYETLSHLFDCSPIKTLNKTETLLIIQEAKKNSQSAISTIKQQLSDIEVDWKKTQTIIRISSLIKQANAMGGYDDIREIVTQVNDSFQKYLDHNYFANIMPSSSYLKPQVVTKILPFLQKNFKNEDKIALIVVDGMSFWQYQILSKRLDNNSILHSDDSLYSWIPSITMLSRQAIFRGDNPLLDYRQNPENESKLWFEFWMNHHIPKHQIAYEYNQIPNTINPSIIRLAYTTTDLDDKMHASTNNKDLHSLTVNWSEKILKEICLLKDAGFSIFLTSDHGNVEAQPAGILSQSEKKVLYKDGSLGARHLIFNEKSNLETFIANHLDVASDFWVHNNWISRKDDKCFSNKVEITHGGSHFLEVLIPFVKI